jgi:hypothetical protein
MSKVQKFCNLYVFVKKENTELFNILEDMCAVGLFRPKYPVTFINPSKAVTAKMVKLVESGHVDTAFEHLQKHFLYGKHASLSKGPFVTYNQKTMKTDLAKATEPNKVFTQWKSDNISVFNQVGNDFLEEGDPTSRPKLERPKKGSSESDSKWDITTRLNEEGNTMHAFAYALNGLMCLLEKKDPSLFEKARKKVDPNPVVAWHIIVKPSAESSEYMSDEVFDAWASAFDENINNRKVGCLKDCFEVSNKEDEMHLAEVNKIRNSIRQSGRMETMADVVKSYKIQNDWTIRIGDQG